MSITNLFFHIILWFVSSDLFWFALVLLSCHGLRQPPQGSPFFIQGSSPQKGSWTRDWRNSTRSTRLFWLDFVLGQTLVNYLLYLFTCIHLYTCHLGDAATLTLPVVPAQLKSLYLYHNELFQACNQISMPYHCQLTWNWFIFSSPRIGNSLYICF